MKYTSHFVWIDLKSELFSSFFIQIYKYTQKHKIEDIILFQNPLSPHITLYYLEEKLNDNTKNDIKKDIKEIYINSSINISWFNYFHKWDWNKFVLYFTSQTHLPLKKYRDELHLKYNRDYVEDNSFSFSPHITFLKILNSKSFEKHRVNIERIIHDEIKKIKNLDINKNKISLYGVNSEFKEEIQIKL